MSTHQQLTSTSSSYKSTTVSILSEDLTDNTIVITHNNTPSSQFTNLIETEKTLLHDERELPNNDFSNSDPVVVVTNTSVELTDDDEFECDREINQITNISNVGRASPEPSGNLELAGIRDGVVIRVGGERDEGRGVEFMEFCVGGEDEIANVSSKSSKSTSKSMSVQKSVQSQSSMEKTCSKQEAVVLKTESSSANQIVETLEPVAVTMVKSESVSSAAASAEEGAVKEKKTKVERKSSKVGKKKGNAEISKENISVTSLTNGSSSPRQPEDTIPKQQILIPEDLAKKLGPGESRVFAKVCVANLRRSFGDLTALNIAAESGPPFNKFSGSNSLEYNRINNRDFKKSSFSKFDSLVAKNGSGAVENKEAVNVGTEQEQASKAEQKKMYCGSCEKQVFQMELIRAEKKDWHKNCFRCVTCRKVLGVDTYQSHEQRLYCKPHFKELFQPKAVVDEGQDEAERLRSSSAKPKLQLIICESQPKELPPDVVRASDTPSTGLEDIQIDVRSKFEMFEGLKEKQAGDKSPEPLVVKRSASVLAKLKKYENSLANGNTELEGVSDEDLHGVDGIELQSEEEEGCEDEGGNSVIKDEIRRKLKNPLQALNEIAHFKQMEQVRSKWEEGTFTRDQMNAESRKEELQKFRSRLCQGKSGQLKEMYEKGVDSGGESLSETRRAEIEELKSERAKAFREMFERGEVIRGEEDEEEDGKVSRNGVDLEVFEAGITRESKKLFEELDKKVVSEKEVVREEKKRMGRFTKGVKVGALEVVCSGAVTPGEVVRCSDKKDEPLVVNTAELSNKFKFFETYEEEMSRKAKEGKRDVFKRITPPREDGVVKTEKDYDETDGDQTYRDPTVVRHGETEEDDTLQKSRTTSKMLSVFRQMEENLSKGDGAKDPIIRPLKQFTPPRDTVGSNGRVVDSEEEEEEEEECEDEDEEEEVEEETGKDDFLKEVGSLARARSLRAKFERWEQQENERNKTAAPVQDELAESIESAKNLKAKFEAMRLMGDGSNKENGKGSSPLPIKVNRFVLNTNNLNSSSSSTSTSPQQLTQFCAFNSLPADVTNHQASLIMSSNEQCALCEKRVYVMEKIEAGGKMYHKNCFRCSQCKCILRMDTFTSNKGTLFCTTHFKQLFKIKGNYDEGFGHETQYQQWAKSKQAQAQQN